MVFGKLTRCRDVVAEKDGVHQLMRDSGKDIGRAAVDFTERRRLLTSEVSGSRLQRLRCSINVMSGSRIVNEDEAQIPAACFSEIWQRFAAHQIGEVRPDSRLDLRGDVSCFFGISSDVGSVRHRDFSPQGGDEVACERRALLAPAARVRLLLHPTIRRVRRPQEWQQGRLRGRRQSIELYGHLRGDHAVRNGAVVAPKFRWKPAVCKCSVDTILEGCLRVDLAGRQSGCDQRLARRRTCGRKDRAAPRHIFSQSAHRQCNDGDKRYAESHADLLRAGRVETTSKLVAGVTRPSWPKSLPTPAVSAIAPAPQNATRAVPIHGDAPLARAASAPRPARQIAATTIDAYAIGANTTVMIGRTAPTANVAADASA